MSMADWHCYKDKVPMEEAEVKVTYLDIEGEAPAIVCPQCGARFVTEETAVGPMAKAEKMIENK